VLLLLVGGGVFLQSCKQENKKQENKKNIKLTNKEILNSTTLTIKDLDSLIRKNPFNDTLFYKRYKLQLADKNIDEAINNLELAIKVDSSKSDYYIDLANLYILKAKSEKSRDILLTAAKRFDDNYKVFTELGKLYFLVQEYGKAHKYLDKAINLYPYDANAYYFKAMAYLETNDTNRAKYFFNKSVETAPDFYNGYIMLGAIALERKDTLAGEYFKTAIRLDSSSVEAHYSLGYFYQTVKKDYPSAVREYEYITTNLDSTFANAYFNIGYLVLFHTRHYKEAIPYFEKVVKIDSTNADAWVNIGLAYKLLGKRDSAKYFMLKALKVRPNYPRAITEINKL
jgi:tetratricopeptide (TPR) repeat protein